VVSELRKPGCDPRVKAWSEEQEPESFFLSTITIAEIRSGIERHPGAAFRSELAAWLNKTLRLWFGARILEVSEDVILEWRRMVERGRRIRHTFSQPDLFLAATAALHGLIATAMSRTSSARACRSSIRGIRDDHVWRAVISPGRKRVRQIGALSSWRLGPSG
jgi:toxin FitB